MSPASLPAAAALARPDHCLLPLNHPLLPRLDRAGWGPLGSPPPTSREAQSTGLQSPVPGAGCPKTERSRSPEQRGRPQQLAPPQGTSETPFPEAALGVHPPPQPQQWNPTSESQVPGMATSQTHTSRGWADHQHDSDTWGGGPISSDSPAHTWTGAIGSSHHPVGSSPNTSALTLSRLLLPGAVLAWDTHFLGFL